MKVERRKGIASIIGFMLVFTLFIIAIVPFSFYLFVTIPFQQVRAANNILQEQLETFEENMQLQTGLFSNGTLYVNATNAGGVGTLLTFMFTVNTTGSVLARSLQIALNQGGHVQVGTNKQCSNANQTSTCLVELVTSRGRTFSQVFPMPLTGATVTNNNNVTNNTNIQCLANVTQGCVAPVSEGLGSLSFDFNSFKWYDTGVCSVDNNGQLVIGQAPLSQCNLQDGLASRNRPFSVPSAPLAYAINQTGMSNKLDHLVFSVNVTNADPQHRPIVLNQFTQLWFSYFAPTQGTKANPHTQILTYYYGLVNMSKPYPSNPSTTSLPATTIRWGENTTLFFAVNEGPNSFQTGTNVEGSIPLCGLFTGSSNGQIPFSSTITPVFVFFSGTLGGLPFGQDFPLASTLWTNIGSTC